MYARTLILISWRHMGLVKEEEYCSFNRVVEYLNAHNQYPFFYSHVNCTDGARSSPLPYLLMPRPPFTDPGATLGKHVAQMA